MRRIPALGRDRDPQVLQRPGVASRPTTSSCSGEAPGLRGFFVGAGFNSVGIASAGRRRAGAGRVGRRGRADQRPGRRSTSAGSRRSTATTRWLRARVAEVLGLHYAVPWPQPRARDRRGRPAARRCTTGWPRAGRVVRLADGLGAAATSSRRPGRGRRLLLGQAGLAAVVGRRAAGHAASAVAVFDQTSFSQVRRRRARTRSRALQWVCAADVDVPVGHVRLHAAAQRARHLRGGPDRHPRPGPASSCWSRSSATTVRDLDWLERHVAGRCGRHGRRRHRRRYAVLGVMGPRSRELLARLTDADLVDEAFPFATSQAIASGRRGRCAPPG